MVLQNTLVLECHKVFGFNESIGFKNHSVTCTTGNRHFAECRRLCRVYFIGHSAKTVFAECQMKYTRKKTLNKMRLCRVPFFWHSTNMCFAEFYFSAHGKIRLCRVPFFGTRQRWVCRVPLFWHSAKRHFAVCIFFGPRQIIFSKQFLRP